MIILITIITAVWLYFSVIRVITSNCRREKHERGHGINYHNKRTKNLASKKTSELKGWQSDLHPIGSSERIGDL